MERILCESTLLSEVLFSTSDVEKVAIYVFIGTGKNNYLINYMKVNFKSCFLKVETLKDKKVL